jgi:hypothetical protein
MKVQLAAQLLKVESLKDRTYKLTFNTQELGGKSAGELLSLVMDEMWLLLATREFTEEDIPEDEAKLESNKTASQRLRNVLFIEWKQKGSPSTFNAWYAAKMERIIEHEKSLLIPKEDF